MKKALLALVLIITALPAAFGQQLNNAGGTLTAQSTDCSTANSCVSLALGVNDSTAAVVLSGTWAGTVTFECSADFGRSWQPAAAVAWASPTATPATTTVSGGGFTIDVAGKTNLRVRDSSFVSGTVVAALASSTVRSSALLSPANTTLVGANLNQTVMANGRALRVNTPALWYANDQVTMKALTATAAVNNQVTLTVPTPAPGQYNYVCSVLFQAVQDNTSTVNTSQVTTSTNFNGFALKYGAAATANTVYTSGPYQFQSPLGCAKSDAPSTATTFVSPSAIANTAFVWIVHYYQAP